MRLARWLGFALVVAGLLRAAALVGHEPLLGYGNQYDMHRTGACVELYPDIPTPRRYEPTPEAPVAVYRWEAPRDGCYGSTEVALAAVVGAGARAMGADHLRIQWLGYAKLALLAFAALSLAWALRDFPRAVVIHAAIVALVLGDPAVTLWFNTLYTEFFVIWGIYASVGAICALAIVVRPSPALWLLAMAGLAALAFSKEQFALLPCAFAIVSIAWLWPRSRAWAAATVLVAFGCAALSQLAVVRHDDVQRMNRAHAYLGLVVPAARDPGEVLRALSLPRSCLAVAGSPWALRRGAMLERECAEVFSLPSTAFLRLLPSHPEALARSVAIVMPGLQQAFIPYLGVVEAGHEASVASLPGWVSAHMNGAVFVAICLAATLVPFIALAAAVRGEPYAGVLLAMLLGGVVIHAMITTVFGDGLTEAGRHFWAGLMALFALMVAAIIGAASGVIRGKREGKLLGAAALVIAGIVGGAFAWTRTQPLAIGLLDAPQACAIDGATLPIRGWALSPNGIGGIEVAIGERRFQASHGKDATPKLAHIFPGYPDSARGGFALDVAGTDLPKEGAPLQVTVTDRLGNANVIDGCPLSRGGQARQ